MRINLAVREVALKASHALLSHCEFGEDGSGYCLESHGIHWVRWMHEEFQGLLRKSKAKLLTYTCSITDTFRLKHQLRTKIGFF